ncbi:MAG: hypothetical protein WC393_02215 [Candidatus Nanoarchaeia archaeon]|jgi:hypothetical protein
MQKYMAFNIEPYFGKSFKTNNSTWSVSKDGTIGGDSRYFIRHPEMVDAKIRYIGGAPLEKLRKIQYSSENQSELEKRTIEILSQISIGNRIIIGASPQNDLEKITQILTTSVNELL